MNLLARETIDLTEGTGGWTVENNCSIARRPSFSPFHKTLDGTEILNSLKITALIGGDASVTTEAFPIPLEGTIKTSIWVTGDVARSVELTIRFYDATNVLIAGSTAFTFTIVPGRWLLGGALATAPANAVTATLLVNLVAPLAGETIWIASPAAFDYLNIRTMFSNYVMGSLPQYLWEADAKQEGYPTWPMLRYLTAATGVASDVADTTVDMDYVRATEGIESLSTLTDPLTADPSWYGWLAQQVGVSLVLVGAGLTSWAAFTDANILTWNDWEQSIIAGGVLPDTTWVGIEGYDPTAALAALQTFQNQILTGFNGVMSSSINSLSGYVQTLLNTTDTSPFVYIHKNYKTNPWYMAIVTLAAEDPDPGGLGLANEVQSGLPAGVLMLTLNGIRSSADLLYQADEFITSLGAAMADGRNTIPIETGRMLKCIPDALDTGRGLVLANYTNVDLLNGGGVARARFFNEGHALYSGAVQAKTASNAAFNQTDWALDLQILISDVTLPSTDRTLAQMDNMWTVRIKTDGNIAFQWLDDTPASNTYTTTQPVKWDRDGPFWLRITREVTTVGADAFNDMIVSVRDTESDVWTEVDRDPIFFSTGVPISNAVNGLSIFSDDTVNRDSALGAVYRLKYATAPQILSAAVTVADIDFLDATNASIFVGTTSFNSVDTTSGGGPGVIAVTVAGAVTGAANYVPSRWVVLKHDGATDFFYLGVSPNKDNVADPVLLGDNLAVNMGASSTYYWTITYYDNSTTQGSQTTTTLTWDADLYGGAAIKDITVRTGSHAGPTVAQFLPGIMSGGTVTGPDTYAKTWTLTRGFAVGAYYYETSSTVDRSLVYPVVGAGVTQLRGFASGSTSGSTYHKPQSASIAYRRYWSASYFATLFDDLILAGGPDGPFGCKLELYHEQVRATITDGVRTYLLTWDELAASRIGEWNLIVLRMDPASDKIELVINGVVEDSADGFFPYQYLRVVDAGSTPDYAYIPDAAGLGITGDIVLSVKAALDSWTAAGAQGLMSKDDGAAEWQFWIDAGVLKYQFWSGGVPETSVATVALTLSPGEVQWVRVTHDVDDGAGNHSVRFYQSEDGIGWSPVGAAVVNAGTGAIDNTAAAVNIGAQGGGSNVVDGRILDAQIASGLSGTSIVLQPLFEDTTLWSTTSTSAVDSFGNTITLKGTAAIQASPISGNPPTITVSPVSIHASGDSAGDWQWSHLAWYDRYLTDADIATLMIEELIT